MPDAPPSGAAARQAEYRRRRREGLLVASAEMRRTLAEAFVASGVLAKAGISDPRHRGAALVVVAEQWVRGIARAGGKGG